MIKRILVAIIIGMMTIGFNVVPAKAYTVLNSGAAKVTITATGVLGGSTESFTVQVVVQGTGAGSTLSFASTSGATADSGKALKIKGGTNEMDSRIIIYTDNDSYFTPGHDPRVDGSGNPTGIDGGGMVGQSEAAYTVALLWGVKCGANNDPNTNEDYAFDGDPGNGLGDVYIVDMSHTHSFTDGATLPTGWTETDLDNNELYKADTSVVTNTDNDDLYPQLWDEDLYDSATPATRKVVSPALYKTIGTIAFGIGAGETDYICSVPKISTTATDDSVTAEIGALAGSQALYYYIAGNFVGKPAQTYTTTQLNIAMVKD